MRKVELNEILDLTAYEKIRERSGGSELTEEELERMRALGYVE